ncbi:MAG: amino acid ABC transporter ATP-binding protein [Kiritimatiellae bacterium]|nr:amino acid ABC transporter ATP-binding protein [Kiritimatiellia bacterium]
MKLEINQLSKTFGAQRVLCDVGIAIEGHAIVLIGPSGGGKSTLLRVIAGLEYPDSGDVRLDGESLRFDEQSLRIHRRRVGVVFQSANLFPHLSALANITLPLTRVFGQSNEEARETAMQLLRRFELGDHAGKRPAQLSGGQRQRVAIVRAVAIRPKFLLFDEPTSALDPEMTSEVLDMISELRAEGRDLLLVTHHLAFARKVADQIAFLASGQILDHAPNAEFFTSPRAPAVQQFLDRVLKY